MQHKVIIDADTGIGDALAIALALASSRLDVIGLTATAGVVSGPQATSNLQTLLETIDPPKWPRIGCSDLPVPISTYESLGGKSRPVDMHGPCGLGEFTSPCSSLQHLKESVKLMTDLVREFPREVTLITFGPLTNVRAAIERSPDFLTELGGLLCFGGTHHGPGDVSPVAEFNIHADPESARAVLTSPATKTLMPIDVARRFVFRFDELRKLDFASQGNLGKMFESLVTYALRANHARMGVEGVSLNEVATLLAFTHPEHFLREMLPLDVETTGELTRGMTVIDRRLRRESVPNIEVITGFSPLDLEHELHGMFSKG